MDKAMGDLIFLSFQQKTGESIMYLLSLGLK